MIDALHEEIDLREELDERTQGIVKDFVQENLASALEEAGGDPEAAMELLAEWFEDEKLTDLTTEAVHRGVEVAVKIYG